MSEGVKPEIPDTCILAKRAHDLLPLCEWSDHSYPCLTRCEFMPEYPSNTLFPISVAPFQDIVQPQRHWYFPRCQMSASFFPGVERYGQLFKVNIIPGQAFDLAHSSQGVTDCPKIILHFRGSLRNHSVDVFL